MKHDGNVETNYNAIVTATDLRVQSRWSNTITLFAALDNVQDLPASSRILCHSYRARIRELWDTGNDTFADCSGGGLS